MKFKYLAILLAFCCAASCKAPEDKGAAFLEKYKDSSYVNQLILVKCTGGSDAVVSFYLKRDNNWKLQGEQQGKIGKNGAGKTREGDGKTPLGEFGVGKAFGNMPNPGTTLEYIDLYFSTFACDEDCEYYNQIIDTVATHHACKGEDMSKIEGYNYGFQILYNQECDHTKGSNIFFHCGDHSTAGCVAVSEDFCAEILSRLTPGCKVCIFEQ